SVLLFFLMLRSPPLSILFPYTTLFRSVSKIMAERIAFKRYRDAQRIFKGALLYAVIVGGVVAVFCVVGAPILIPDSMANARLALDRKSTRLNSSHVSISYAVFCLKKQN